MVKIIKANQAIVKFLLLLKLNMSEPHMRHIKNFMDALIACDGTKTIAKLNRLILEPTDQSAFTDFMTYSPSDDQRVEPFNQEALPNWVLQENQNAHTPAPVYLSLDDSKTIKAISSKGIQVLDWWFNTTKGRGYFYGAVFVTVHISCGNRSLPIALRLYLRQKTVRRINRKREQGKRISFKSKYKIVSEILEQLSYFIPKKQPVYVLFDSWYARAKLIKQCCRRGWHVICALKHNRKLTLSESKESKQLSQHARKLRHKDFKPVTVKSSDSSTRYLVTNLCGRLNDIGQEVCILFQNGTPKTKVLNIS